METQELHRGRLIDHLQLVVRDLPASQRFYEAVFKVLEVPMGGSGDGWFWADELFVSTRDSEAAQGVLTGRHHLAFQAATKRWCVPSTKPRSNTGARTTAHRASASTTRATTPPSCSIPMATTSKPFSTGPRSAARLR